VLNGRSGRRTERPRRRVIKIEPALHGDYNAEYGPFVKGPSLYFSFLVNAAKVEHLPEKFKEEADRARVPEHGAVRPTPHEETFGRASWTASGIPYQALLAHLALIPVVIYAPPRHFGQTGPLRTFPALRQRSSGDERGLIIVTTGFRGAGHPRRHVVLRSGKRNLHVRRMLRAHSRVNYSAKDSWGCRRGDVRCEPLHFSRHGRDGLFPRATGIQLRRLATVILYGAPLSFEAADTGFVIRLLK